MKSLTESILSTNNAGPEALVDEWMKEHSFGNYKIEGGSIRMASGRLCIKWGVTELPRYIKFAKSLKGSLQIPIQLFAKYKDQMPEVINVGLMLNNNMEKTNIEDIEVECSDVSLVGNNFVKKISNCKFIASDNRNSAFRVYTDSILFDVIDLDFFKNNSLIGYKRIEIENTQASKDISTLISKYKKKCIDPNEHNEITGELREKLEDILKNVEGFRHIKLTRKRSIEYVNNKWYIY